MKNAFTLIELLITISIVAILSGFILISINPARQIDNAKVAKSVSNMQLIKNAVAEYVVDTLQFPPDCRLNCTVETDPMLNSLGVDGWNGPYLEGGLWNRKHPWGGHLGIFSWDFTEDGKDELWLILDDDAPGTDSSDNSGGVPLWALQKINDSVDLDDDLNSGEFFRGHNSPFAENEGAWRIYQVGQQ